ncbi:extensin-like [Varroa destructor]|uniref:Uncharacterized protein n=1 Tax=Varroa destructor TaxID=109461 RepID=A0A7M7JFL9_VARDE|nr:extensin-like [Varroa destructor]
MMRIFQVLTIAIFSYLVVGQKNDKDDDKFSIGLGVLAPSYRQKVGTGKELGAQIDFNAEGKGFSYTVSQGDPSSGKPYSSIQISRPAPAEAPESATRPVALPAQYQLPPQYTAPAPAPRYINTPSVNQASQQQYPQYQPPSQQYQPRPQQYQPSPQQYTAAAPQYNAPAPPPPQYTQPAPIQYQSKEPSTQYVPTSNPGVQYAPAITPPYTSLTPQHRSSSISYQPQLPEANLPQVAPQPFGGPTSTAALTQFQPRYQNPASPAYPNALAAPQTYNAPSSASQTPVAAPDYIPSVQNVKYQYGSGAELAFASQLSIFGQQNGRLS